MKQSEEKNVIGEIIQEWKKLNVYQGRFEFSCGGDSMNETELTFYDNDDKPISKTQVLNDYFEDEIYKKVEFYEASDGHYIGEMGTVYITLNDDEDDFEYEKSSTSEWSESYTEEVQIELTDEEKKFIEEYVDDFEGDNGTINFNYTKDFVLTNEKEELVSNLENKITNTCDEYEFDESDGEQQDEIRYESNGEVTIVDNKLSVFATRWFYETKEEYN